MTDGQLLDRYRKTHCEDAFRQLMQRHGDWVYCCARKEVGDAHLAEDVTQAVFAILAQKVHSLSQDRPLETWLFRVLHYTAANTLRRERRRAKRERDVALLAPTTCDPQSMTAAQWETIILALHEVIKGLGEKDQQAVLLRFYRRQTFAEIGTAMRISDQAARKRVGRALTKLRQSLQSRGITLSAGALAAGLFTYTAQPASAGLIASIIGGVNLGSVAKAPAGWGMAKVVLKITSWMPIKLVAPYVGMLAVVAVSSLVAHQVALRSMSMPIGGQVGMGKSAARIRPVNWESLEAAVLEGISNNQSRLTSCVIVWDRITKEDGFVPGRKQDTKGSYQLWSIGEKIATRSSEEGPRKLPGGTTVVGVSGMITAYDGKEFRATRNVKNPEDIAIMRDPKYMVNQNWFHIVEWGGTDAFPEMYRIVRSLGYIEIAWSLRQLDGVKCIVFEGTNKKTGGRQINYFDPAKGFCSIREEWYDPAGRLRLKRVATVAEVADQVWMPVELRTQSIDVATGAVTLENYYKIRLQESSFNDPSAVPKDVFTIALTDEMEVSDYRGGARIEYTKDVKPLLAETVRSLGQKFLSGGAATHPTTQENGALAGPAPKGKIDIPSAVATTPWWGWMWVMIGVGLCLIGIWWLRRIRHHHPAK
jgi:RNA polymerase sigma factor (sigma-70 family)